MAHGALLQPVCVLIPLHQALLRSAEGVQQNQTTLKVYADDSTPLLTLIMFCMRISNMLGTKILEQQRVREDNYQEFTYTSDRMLTCKS